MNKQVQRYTDSTPAVDLVKRNKERNVEQKKEAREEIKHLMHRQVQAPNFLSLCDRSVNQQCEIERSRTRT